MNTKQATSAALLLAAVFLTGCASTSSNPNPPSSSTQYPAAPVTSSNFGVIDSIQAMPGSSGGNTTAGTVAGGVVGGVLGNQVGGGRGRTAATVAGAVGGAMAGNAMQRNAQTASETYQIGVQMDNDTHQTIQQDSVAGLSVGSRVRVQDGHVYAY